MKVTATLLFFLLMFVWLVVAGAHASILDDSQPWTRHGSMTAECELAGPPAQELESHTEVFDKDTRPPAVVTIPLRDRASQRYRGEISFYRLPAGTHKIVLSSGESASYEGTHHFDLTPRLRMHIYTNGSDLGYTHAVVRLIVHRCGLGDGDLSDAMVVHSGLQHRGESQATPLKSVPYSLLHLEIDGLNRTAIRMLVEPLGPEPVSVLFTHVVPGPAAHRFATEAATGMLRISWVDALGITLGVSGIGLALLAICLSGWSDATEAREQRALRKIQQFDTSEAVSPSSAIAHSETVYESAPGQAGQLAKRNAHSHDL